LYSDYLQATVSLHVHEILTANVDLLRGREELCSDVYEKMKHWENTIGMKWLVAYSRYREESCLYLAGTLNRSKLSSTVYNKIRRVINKS
jgi:hypothetical protein